MAAIIGLDDARLPDLVAQASAHGVFGVANRNSPGQVVVSGERPAIEASLEIAKALGAKRAIELPVSVAAHSPLMAEAAEGMRSTLAGIAFADPRPPLLANADARPITTAEGCRDELVEHLTTGVDWVGAVETMRAAGVTTFIEVGPGRVLTGLIKRIAPDALALALDDPGGRRPPRHPVRRQRGRRGRDRDRRLAAADTHERTKLRQPDFSRRVVVTGLGVISPVGNDKATAWENLVNGRSGLGRDHQVRHLRLLPQVGRRGPRLRRGAVDGPQGHPAQRGRDVVRRGGRQAGGRRRGPRDHGRATARTSAWCSARAPAARR